MVSKVATILPTTASQPDLDRLGQSYALRNPEEVAAFVWHHPEVIDPLLTAADIVPRYFGPDVPLVLVVEWAQEGDGRPELVALIQTDLDADAALAALDRFDQDWWLDILHQTGSKLLFGLEYV